jgi:2,3-bisphosphoglycerate-independent phosphoglycerate mutase
MRILFLFLDGVGLGEDDPQHNPFAAVELPTLMSFTEGQRWLRDLPPITSKRGLFIPTDACLGIEGRPQSATGQAAILTGLNVPAMLGYHYGPRPNQAIAEVVRQENLIQKLVERGLHVGFPTAFPPAFFENVARGKRMLSTNQLAMHMAGVTLPDMTALLRGHAMSADFTGEGWRTQLGYEDTPVMSPFQAGQMLGRLASRYDLTFFDHWVTDYLGHRGTLQQAITLLKVIDDVLAGLLSEWEDTQGLIILTSDHGNLEDLSHRRHTRNPVPTLIIGEASHTFARGLSDLTGFAAPILHTLDGRKQS